jgi:hypothetical protein
MCFTLVIIFFYWHSLRWYDIGAALLYLVNFDYLHPWIIGHLWSLSVEEQFYLLWPSILKKWYRHRMIILWAAIFLAPIARTVFFFLKVAGGGYGNLLTVGDNLATGCLLAMLGSRIGEIRWMLAAVMVLAVIFIPLYDADSPLRRVHALRAIPDSPFLNCRNSLARRATSVPFAELHASRLAGENQLQSVPLATTILRSRFISKIWRAVGPRIGLYFLLSRRDSDAAPA